MDFQQDKVDTFLEIFLASKYKILAMEGCRRLELLNSITENGVFFTYSEWESPEHLEKYRNSQVFKETWAKTKPLFRIKAEAWSVVNTER